MNENRIEYMYQSIADTQSAIRAIDTKAGFLFIIICLPLAKLHRVVAIMKFVYFHIHYSQALIVISCLSWLIGMIAIFLSIVAVSNSRKHVKGEAPQGTFFGEGIFKITTNNFFCPNSILSTVSVDELLSKIPSRDERILKELIYEKIKLSYIRDVKFKIFTIAIFSTLIWILSGVTLWVLQILTGY